MGYRRWYRAVDVDRSYLEALKSVQIVCVYCRLESTLYNRAVPDQGFGSVATYVKHSANQHMWVHGMLSVNDVRLQTFKWDAERVQRSRKPFVYDLGMLRTVHTYRPEVFGNLNLD